MLQEEDRIKTNQLLGLAAIAGIEIMPLRVFGECTSLYTYCSFFVPQILTARIGLAAFGWMKN